MGSKGEAVVNYGPIPGAELPGSLKKEFKELFKFLEEHVYKRAITAADKILKSAPNHGETQALRALCFLNMNKKEECLEGVKAALKANIK